MKYVVYADAGHGNEIYISGADDSIGKWTSARKMKYNSVKNVWEINLNLALGIEFKFLRGAWTDEDTKEKSDLEWENRTNRKVIKLYNGDIILENFGPVFD